MKKMFIFTGLTLLIVFLSNLNYENLVLEECQTSFVELSWEPVDSCHKSILRLNQPLAILYFISVFFSTVMLIFLPGYWVTSYMFSKLEFVEMLVLSCIMSLTITGIVAFFLSMFWLTMSLWSVFISMGMIVVLFLVLTFLSEKQGSNIKI